jgi:hypothetical protein
MNQTSYFLTFHISDYPCDHTEYVNIDDAYDAADIISASTHQAVNIYENNAHFALVRNY